MPAEIVSNEDVKVSQADTILDRPLSSVRSFDLAAAGSESESESDSEANSSKENTHRAEAANSQRKEKKEKKVKKDKKEKKHKKDRKSKKSRPPLLNHGASVAKVKKHVEKDVGGVMQKRDLMRNKVLKFVAEYIEEHPYDWTPSVMREDISDRYGFENNVEFKGYVTSAILSLGVSVSVLKAQ